MMFMSKFPLPGVCSLIIFFAFINDKQGEARCCFPRRKPKCPSKTSISPSSPSSLSTALSVSSSSSSALPTTTPKVTKPQITTPLATTTKMSMRGDCTLAECHCTCGIPEDLTKDGTIYGFIPINGTYARTTDTSQCQCTQPSYYTPVIVPALKTPETYQFQHQILISVFRCKRLCMLSEDGIFYLPQNDFDIIYINYYCDNNTDPKSCSFYAYFIPLDGNPRNVTLVSDDGKHVYQNGDNSELLGQASSYLKILGVSCAGCCDLSAALFGPSCSPQGVFFH